MAKKLDAERIGVCGTRMSPTTVVRKKSNSYRKPLPKITAANAKVQLSCRSEKCMRIRKPPRYG